MSWSVLASGHPQSEEDTNFPDPYLIHCQREKQHSIYAMAVDASSPYEQKIINMLTLAFSPHQEDFPYPPRRDWKTIQILHHSDASPSLPKFKMKIKRHKNHIWAATYICDTTQRYDAKYAPDAFDMPPDQLVIAALLEQLRVMGYVPQVVTPYRKAKEHHKK
ncbi:hypothetical protein [Castellaniella sp. MT123]|uniref:hypothetical protein n=1 Tax=Castellaniella sp. MT123 TaxID=3140381 RepID=UPI0031F428F8